MENKQEQNNANIKQIVYNEYFDQTKGNLLEAPNQFMDYLDSHSQIDILGKVDQNVILSTDDQTFRLKGINLPTSLLVIDHFGLVNLEVNNYIKMDEYDHQYQKIYDQIMETTFSLQQFLQSDIQTLLQYYGRDQIYIKYNFKISMAEFRKFQVFLDFVKIDDKWLFIPLSVQMHVMRELLLFLAQKNISSEKFTYQMVKDFPTLDCPQLFQLIANKFYLNVKQSPELNAQQKIQEHTIHQKMEIQQVLVKQKLYQINFASISNAKKQYIAKEMDELINQMMAMYLPTGLPNIEQTQLTLMKNRMMAKFFIQGKRNHIPARFYYNPLLLQSTIKGRLKFMSEIKTRFTYDQILGIFDCMIIKQSCKTIKQKVQNGRKSIDMDDVLLKNFRKFGKEYQIKLIMPK